MTIEILRDELQVCKNQLSRAYYNDASSLSFSDTLALKSKIDELELKIEELENTQPADDTYNIIKLGSVITLEVIDENGVKRTETLKLLANPLTDLEVDFCTVSSELGRTLLNLHLGESFIFNSSEYTVKKISN